MRRGEVFVLDGCISTGKNIDSYSVRREGK